MKSDFEAIKMNFPEREDIVIYPLDDLHIGAPEFMTDKWRAFKKTILAEPNSYITIGGDMMNNTTRSSISNIFEETMRPRDQKKWLMENLSDIADKILCVVPGNHEGRSEKDADDNPLYDVCCKLNIEDIYRPNMAFLKIKIGKSRQNGDYNPTYCIANMHGAGGGIYTGATVNRNERTAFFMDGIDVLIVGHSHKGAHTKPKKIVMDRNSGSVKFQDITVIGATSWTEYGGYALRKQLIPASNKLQKIILSGKEKNIQVLW